MRHAATINCPPPLQQAAGLATAEGSRSSGPTTSHPITLSSSTINRLGNENSSSCNVNNAGSSNRASSSNVSSSKEDILERPPGGESCSSCWEGTTSFLVQSKTYRTSTSDLLQLQQQQKHSHERRTQEEQGQQRHFYQHEQQLPREHEEEERRAPSVCGKTQRKQQHKHLHKQHYSSTVKADAPHGGRGINTPDAQGKTSDGGKATNSTKGRSRSSSSRTNNNSSAIEENSDSGNKKQNSPADSAETECLPTQNKELQVTADYTLVSRGLVDMTYMQLEAARPPEELPAPEVGETVESKAAHPDAQIFKARVLDRWQDPEHLWMFKLRSPDMAAPYLEPLKHVRKDSVWTLARELDIAGGRKSRRCSSSLQQQHNAGRSSSCTPYSSAAAAAPGSCGKPSSSSSTQVHAGGSASASAPAACSSASASKKNQPHRFPAGLATATAASAGPRAAAKTAATAAVQQKAPPSSNLQRPVTTAVASSSCAVAMRSTAVKSHAVSSSAALAANSSTAIPLLSNIDHCSGLPQHCRPVHCSQRAGTNTIGSDAAAAVRSAAAPYVAAGVANAPSTPLPCQPPAVAVPLGTATGITRTGSGTHVADAGPFPVGSYAQPLPCAAESPCAVPSAAAPARTSGQQPPPSATTRPSQPPVQPVSPPCNTCLNQLATTAKPPATAVSPQGAKAMASAPIPAPAVASSFAGNSLFSKQLVGCSAAGTPQQDACKPLSYSSLVPELCLSPAPPPTAASETSGAAAPGEKEEASKSDLLRKNPDSNALNLAPAITSPSTDTSASKICNASTTPPAAVGGQQLAAVERRCSSPADLSLRFVSPSLEPAKRTAAGGTMPEIRDEAKAVRPAAALSLGAATARKSWPARSELLLKDGIGLHQQRLQRLFLAAAATAAAREYEQETQELAQSRQDQQQQHQQQQPVQHQSEQLPLTQDVSENSRRGAAAFCTPLPVEINGANSCCLACPPTAAGPSDGAKKIEKSGSDSSGQTSAVAALQLPSGATGWREVAQSTAADTAPHASPVLHDKHPQPNPQKQQQPHQQQQRHQQSEQQQEPQQQQQMTASNSMGKGEYFAAHWMRPRRSLPAYQRLERMLFLKQLVPLSPADTAPVFPCSPAAVTSASLPVADGDTAATAPAAAAQVTFASPASVTDACDVAGGTGERREGRGSPAGAEPAVATPCLRADAGTAAAVAGGTAAAASKQIPAADAAEGSAADAAIQRSAAGAARRVATTADVAAGLAAAEPTASRLQKALPDTKKVRRSSNSTNNVEVGCSSDASSSSGNLARDSATPGSSLSESKKECLACVKQQHGTLLSTDTKTYPSCSSSSTTDSKATSNSTCGSGSKTSSNSSSRTEGVELGSEESCNERSRYDNTGDSSILQQWSRSRAACSSSTSGCSTGKSGTSPIKSREGGSNSGANVSRSSSSSGDMERKIEASWKAVAVEEAADLPCSLLRMSGSCCGGGVLLKENQQLKSSDSFTRTAAPHQAQHQLRQPEPRE